jgi:hypothetical protein
MKNDNTKRAVQKKEIKTPSGLTVKVAYKSAGAKRLLENGVITEEDAEMDKRAKEAISVAIKKRKVLAKPVAVYDKKTQKAYLEYADGKRKEVKK